MSAFRHLCVDWRDGGKLKECRRHAVKLEQGFGHVLGRLCLLILERRQLYFARGYQELHEKLSYKKASRTPEEVVTSYIPAIRISYPVSDALPYAAQKPLAMP